MPVDTRGPAVAWSLFAATPLLYLVQQLLTSPRPLLGGEMWAEMSTNYYAAAQAPDLLSQLLAIDAGYIPLPQRIVGVVGSAFGLSPSAIPYYYSGAALLLTALLVGSVCLPVFRPLISNDWLRFALVAAVLLLLDGQTRTYINFTYVIVVPAAFLSALAFVGRDVPRWAWVLPVLMISKPAVLSVLPVIVVAGLVARGRFRWIAALSVVAAAMQVVRLAISSTLPNSLLQPGADTSLLEKLRVALKYTLGFAGRLVVAPNGGIQPGAAMLVGAVVLMVLLAGAAILRTGASALVVAGALLVAANMVLNAVVYPVWFNADMGSLTIMGFDRRVIIAVLGVLISVVGILAALTESRAATALTGRIARRLGAGAGRAMRAAVLVLPLVVLLVWSSSVGWTTYSAVNNAPRGAPLTDVDTWSVMAPALAGPQTVVCVPTAPFGWAYGRGCRTLAGAIPSGLEFRDVPLAAGGSLSTRLTVPSAAAGGSVAAVAVLVAPTQATLPIRAILTLTTSSGDRIVYRSQSSVPLTGGTLLFEGAPAVPVPEVRSASISFDTPARIGWSDDPAGGKAVAVMWMGD